MCPFSPHRMQTGPVGQSRARWPGFVHNKHRPLYSGKAPASLTGRVAFDVTFLPPRRPRCLFFLLGSSHSTPCASSRESSELSSSSMAVGER
jgi:hypothetical protein